MIDTPPPRRASALPFTSGDDSRNSLRRFKSRRQRLATEDNPRPLGYSTSLDSPIGSTIGRSLLKRLWGPRNLLSDLERTEFQTGAASGYSGSQVEALAAQVRAHGSESAAPSSLAAALAHAAFIAPDRTADIYDHAAAGWFGKPVKGPVIAPSVRGPWSEPLPQTFWDSFWGLVEDTGSGMGAAVVTTRTAALGACLPSDFAARLAPACAAYPGVVEAAAKGVPGRFRLEDLAACPDGSLGNAFYRLIVDNNITNAAPALRKRVRSGNGGKGAIHALWALEGIGALDKDTHQKALLDKAPPKPALAGGSQQAALGKKGPVAGAPEGTDTVLTASQNALLGKLIKDAVSRCWNINSGAEGMDKVVVKLEVNLRPDGRLAQPPRIVNSMPGPLFADTANSAVRAVIQCEPYSFPAELYKGGWDSLVWTFDPRKMF